MSIMKNIFFFISFLIFPLISFAANERTELISMYAPGGAADIISRHMSKNMGEETYYVVNRTGGLGQIAIKQLMSSESIMIILGPQIYVVNPIINKNLNYDPEKDLEIIGIIGVMPSVLVCNKKTGIYTINDFVLNKKSLKFGSSGYGSNEYLTAELLNKKTKSHNKIIPYPHGGATAIPDLLGGHIDCMFANYPTIKNYLGNNTISVILTSHNIELTENTWASYFKENFPITAYVAVTVSKKSSEKFKSQIKLDLHKTFNNADFGRKISELGFIPVVSVDSSAITEFFNNNKQIENFILKNNIQLIK